MNATTKSAPASAGSEPGIQTQISDRLRRLRHVALDLDGTLYRGGTLFAATLPFLRTLDALGIGHTFVTNNSSRSTDEYVAKLNALGIPARPEQVMVSTQAALHVLRLAWPAVRRLYVLGTAGMTGELAAAGYTLLPDSADAEPDAVVVGFDPEMTYAQLCRAAWWIARGKPYLATNPDFTCPTDEPTVLVDCGSICAALQRATGRAPDIVAGKPHPVMLHGLCVRHGLQPAELAMVGDRLMTDITMAQAVGALAVLVLSGEATRADAKQARPAPDLVVRDVGELGDVLRRTRTGTEAMP